MERGELITSREHVFTKMQLDLLNLIESYMGENGLTRTQLADKLGVHKSYITQLLNVSFDHKMSTVVDLALDCNKIPILSFVDKTDFIKIDAEDKIYGLFPMIRPRNITFEVRQREAPAKQENAIFLNEFVSQNQFPHGE
jgi:transcriptional regulator with XRE-family HTH domain